MKRVRADEAAFLPIARGDALLLGDAVTVVAGGYVTGCDSVLMSDGQGSDGRSRGIDTVAFASPSILGGRPHPRARDGQLPGFDISGTRASSSRVSSNTVAESRMLSQWRGI
jgi:hypothetical protein